MKTMNHSMSKAKKRRFLETHIVVGTSALGETLYEPIETPAPPLTDEELKAVEALKEDGTLYNGNDVEPW